MTTDTPKACAPSVETPAMTADTQAPAPFGDMVLVPREPTERMLNAADKWTDLVDAAGENTRAYRLAEFRTAWWAMLAAAPPPSASTMGVDVDVLRRLEGACEKLASLRSASTYREMLLDQGAEDALLALDEARKSAREAIQSCLSSAGGEGTVEAAARLPVARIINDNQPGATAIVKIVCDPPTLGVGTLLYSRPRDHAAELVEAYCAGQRDASPTPPKAETETASERERLVEALRQAETWLDEAWTALCKDNPHPSSRDEAVGKVLITARCELPALRRAALAQEPAR